jgi:hypothetical protein
MIRRHDRHGRAGVAVSKYHRGQTNRRRGSPPLGLTENVDGWQVGLLLENGGDLIATRRDENALSGYDGKKTGVGFLEHRRRPDQVDELLRSGISTSWPQASSRSPGHY